MCGSPERPALQTCLDIRYFPGQRITTGQCIDHQKERRNQRRKNIKEVTERKSCTFERIYFSRGTDRDIYLERKNLGRLFAPRILSAVNHDFEHTIFFFHSQYSRGFVFGLIEGLNEELNQIKAQKIATLEDRSDVEAINQILQLRVRSEKLAVKDEN